MRPLVVLGNVNVDFILGPAAPWPQAGTEIFVDHDELRVGGSAGNTALAWQGMGLAFKLCASRGTDAFGTMLESAFSPENTKWCIDEARTTVSVGITHPDGERTFLTTRGHLPQFSASQAMALLDGVALAGGWLLLSGAFQTEGLLAAYPALIDHARSLGARVAVDPGWPPQGWTPEILAWMHTVLKRCDCALLNEVEAQSLTSKVDAAEAAETLKQLMPHDAIAVVKCGPKGALAVTQDHHRHACSAPAVTVIDTIGAGDVFNAGFLAALADDTPVQPALQRAVALASRAISTSPRRFS